MKYFAIIAMVVLFLASAVIPACANTRAENNKNIADFISDTIKLPFILVGAFVTQNQAKVESDVNYKGNEGLNKCLRKQEVQPDAKDKSKKSSKSSKVSKRTKRGTTIK